VSSAPHSERRVLDVGCGRDKLPGATGMDQNPRSHADVIHNLDHRPWPLADSSFDHVRAQDILEHVDDFFGVMEEIHRVCRDGATVLVRMPFMSSLNFATDPTHRRSGTSGTFDYFDSQKPLGQYAYTDAQFELVDFRYGRFYHGIPGFFMKIVDKLFVPFCERYHVVYEHYYAYVYPMHDITYRLKVKKSPANAP
jgi:SAM-dependent methyltransferase